jgi:hypothetical protein
MEDHTPLARGGAARAVALLVLALLTRPIQAKDAIHLKQAGSHPIRYYLSLPEHHDAHLHKPWPILICVPGVDADFRGLLLRYQQARGDRPFVLVAPCVFSCAGALRGDTLAHYRQFYDAATIASASGTGLVPQLEMRLDWDEAGLLAILADLAAADLAAAYPVERRAYITGFSGGGFLAYRMILHHPDRLAGAALVCANFNFWSRHGGMANDLAPEAKSFPIFVLTGGNDPLRRCRLHLPFYPPPGSAAVAIGAIGAILGWRSRRRRKWLVGTALAVGLLLGGILVGHGSGNEAQSALAVRALHRRGYANVQPQILAALGHEPAPELVLERLQLR